MIRIYIPSSRGLIVVNGISITVLIHSFNLWYSDYVNEIFNTNSFLALENESEQAINNLIIKIKELDSNDEMYLKMLNEPAISIVKKNLKNIYQKI